VYIQPVPDLVAGARVPTERRWRAFADAVAFALGINVWVSVVVLPGLFIGAAHGPAAVLVGAVPLAILILGLWLRSETILLLAYPGAILLPIGLAPHMASSYVYGPVRFTIVALGVAAYLFGVSFFTTFHEPPPPVSTRALSSAQAGTPHRWRRRERVYWTLFALSLVFPALLIAWVNFDSQIQAYIGEKFAGRVALMTTVLNVGVIVLWLGIYHYAFLGVLRPHRTGDRDLATAIGIARADARSGRPRRRFYAGVLVALLLMAFLLFARHT
jgi:hypothetical protein